MTKPDASLNAGCPPANLVVAAGKKPKHRSAIIDRENRMKIILLQVSVLFTIVLIGMFLLCSVRWFVLLLLEFFL